MILQETGGSPDGGYSFDPDGTGEAGTNPALLVRTTNLPKMGADTLGTDEGGTATWGHAAPSLLAKLPFNELRFTCRSSAHSRVVDFRTVSASCIADARTGTGWCAGAAAEYIPLAGATGQWACDQQAQGTGSDTIHRVWIR